MRDFTRFRIFFSGLVLFFSLATGAQQPHVSIRFVQDEMDHSLGPGNDSLTLQKKGFRIQLMLEGVEGVYVHISFSDSLHQLPPGAPVPRYDQLPALTMAEENFNKEKELLVDDEGWSYWFYDPGTHWHRFNKKIIFLDKGRVVGTKTVKQLYFVQTGESRKLKEIHRPLYLFFIVPAGKDAAGKPVGELQRARVRIDWREED